MITFFSLKSTKQTISCCDYWEFTFIKFYKNKFIDSREIKLVASPQDYHQQKSLKLKLPQDQLRIDQNL